MRGPRRARAKPTATRSRPTSSAPRRRSASLAGLERTTLTALFAGIVARVTGEVGEFTTPSPPGIPRPPAVDLIDDSCVYVSAPTRSSTTLRADAVVDDLTRRPVAPHGNEDFTVTPQQQMLDTPSTVLDVLTFAVAALGGISLLVGAGGMVTPMHIAAAERIAEIGLLTALGATRARIRTLFLMESIVLSTRGGLAGLILGGGVAWLLETTLAGLPVDTHGITPSVRLWSRC